jgi:hypothetical protein
MSHLRLSESKTQSVESIEESLRSFRLNDDDKEKYKTENDETENDDKEIDKTEKDETENDVSEIVTHTKTFLEDFFSCLFRQFFGQHSVNKKTTIDNSFPIELSENKLEIL